MYFNDRQIVNFYLYKYVCMYVHAFINLDFFLYYIKN